MLQRLQLLSAFPLNCLWLPAMEGWRERRRSLAWNICRIPRLSVLFCTCWWLPSCFTLTPTLHSSSNWVYAKTQVLQIARAGNILVKSISVISSRNTTQYFPAFLMRPWLDIIPGWEVEIKSLFSASAQHFHDGVALSPFGDITYWFICNKCLLHTYYNSYLLIQWCY